VSFETSSQNLPGCYQLACPGGIIPASLYGQELRFNNSYTVAIMAAKAVHPVALYDA
jgi:hypothetical protein